ncbi:cytochrome b/b6 domain-containing protein [Afifella pfennigii]|uniref:cytochrome b/b6 domain-containing protein n=1 Tax=Afifella pfennigii TaxID=209897 RepID=UPI00068D320C|nr:cytochrome b/b6 domain-containing protein [Afifella pfennigii]
MLQKNTEQTREGQGLTVPVWDIWVRLFHWLLLACVATATVTGFFADATWLRLHIAGGLGAAGLVLARIVWGFTGPTHARFKDFFPRPSAVMEHLRGGGGRHRGHNPLGGAMVFAFFLAILFLAATGLAILGGAFKTGPLAFAFTFQSGHAMEEVHELIALALLVMIGLHVAGVVLESFRSRENLARGMVTGEKEWRADDHQPRIARPRGLAAAAAIAAVGAVLILANTGLSARPVPGMPVANLDPTYAQECGDCHTVYHPSLLPAASWRALMPRLADHFGENASLGPELTAELEAYLVAHAAETADTKAANRMARGLDAPPLAMTETPFWKHQHEDLAKALFASDAVGSASNCAACHLDAETGLFSPLSISIPKQETIR